MAIGMLTFAVRDAIPSVTYVTALLADFCYGVGINKLYKDITSEGGINYAGKLLSMGCQKRSNAS